MTVSLVNGDGFDEELVKKYLEAYPHPSVETMKSWVPTGKWEEGWQEFQAQDWDYKLSIFRRVMPNGNVIIDGLPQVPVRKLFIKYSKQAIQLEPCEVISISQSEPYAEFVTFKCLSCESEQTIRKEESGEKKTCVGCSKPKLVEITNLAKDAVDSQYVRLQEVQYDGSEMPSTINGLLKREEMIWSIKFNERVSPVGMLRYTKTINSRTRQTEYHPWFEIYGVKKIDPDAANPLTAEDVMYIESEMAKPGYYDKLIRSVFPAIWGMHSMKEALMLALASIKLPRPARIMIATDPGMGKSKMVKIMKLYWPDAILTQMGRSTGTGLTVSSEMDEETGRSHIGRGALVQGNNGIVVLDEAQFGDPKTFMMLNDVMESGQVKYAFRGGNVGHVDANAAIIMLANPHDGNFGTDQSIGEIFKFMGNALPQQMSRLQYVLLRRGKLTPEEHRKIAGHMARHNENNPLYMSQYQENWIEYEEETVEIVPGLSATYTKSAEERFGTKWIKKILRYVINEIQVSEMPQQHMQTLVEYYMKNRTDIATETNKMLTNRFMEHGQNLAIYMARIKGKSSPSAEEIFHTMDLLEKSMDVNAFDPKTGKHDYQQFDTVRPETERDEMDKEEQFEEAIRKALQEDENPEKEKKPYFVFDDLLYHLQFMPNSKWKDSSESRIRRELNKWEKAGKLREKHGQGKYSLW